MAIPKLPAELISLVHHIELNKAGWWDKALQQLLVAAIWISGKDQSVPEILAGVKKAFQVDIETEKAQPHLDTLCSKGMLICLPQARYKISEQFLERYQGEIAVAENLEKSVQDSFSKVLARHCPSLDTNETWKDFNGRFLLPLVRDVGANTYQLLSQGSLGISPARFARFASTYPKEIHEPFAELIKEFLDPKDLELRSYILGLLNAYFFIEASSLTAETIEALIKLSGAPPSFYVFVDTNFLFSILGLVPSASDGSALVRLISRLQGKITVKLYALPTTIDEAKRTLINAKQRLAGLRIVPNLAEAAAKMNLDGLQIRYFEESPKRGLISAEDYFEPYINDLISMIRTKGIEFYNEDIDKYKTRPDVIDDIVFQLDSEKKKYKERAKNYERLEHDMVLWHVARDRRPIRIDSPLDAHYWVVTIDYRMLGFDKFKKRMFRKGGQENLIPVCLYPTTLIQMLQFWIPRSPEFEEAMLSSMRLPFLYREFDPVAEKVTLDILKTMSRYEGVEELGTDAVSSMLVSAALRSKMSDATKIEKKAKLIKEALLEQHNRATVELKAATERLRSREKQLEMESRSKSAAEQALATRTTDLTEIQAEVANLKANANAEKQTLAIRIAQLEEDVRLKEQERQLSRERTSFIVRWTSFPFVGLVVLVTGAAVAISQWTQWNFWKGTLILAAVFGMLWIAMLDWRGSSNAAVRDWQAFLIFKRLKKWLFTLFGALILGVAGNYLYDLFKSLRSSS